VNKEAPALTDELSLPQKKMFESHDNYDSRVRAALREQLSPRFDVLEAKAGEAEQAKKDVKEARETVKAWHENFAPAWDIIGPLDSEQRDKILEVMKDEAGKMVADKERQKQAEHEAKQARIAHRKRQRSLSDLGKKKPKGVSR